MQPVKTNLLPVLATCSLDRNKTLAIRGSLALDAGSSFCQRVRRMRQPSFETLNSLGLLLDASIVLHTVRRTTRTLRDLRDRNVRPSRIDQLPDRGSHQTLMHGFDLDWVRVH